MVDRRRRTPPDPGHFLTVSLVLSDIQVHSETLGPPAVWYGGAGRDTEEHSGVWSEDPAERGVAATGRATHAPGRPAGGIHRRRREGVTVRDPEADVRDDLVKRRFRVDTPDRLWIADVTQQRCWDGILYLAVVIDAFSRRVVGWSIADHLRSELVCDALDMPLWRRRPDAGTIHHSDHGCQGGSPHANATCQRCCATRRPRGWGPWLRSRRPAEHRARSEVRDTALRTVALTGEGKRTNKDRLCKCAKSEM